MLADFDFFRTDFLDFLGDSDGSIQMNYSVVWFRWIDPNELSGCLIRIDRSEWIIRLFDSDRSIRMNYPNVWSECFDPKKYFPIWLVQWFSSDWFSWICLQRCSAAAAGAPETEESWKLHEIHKRMTATEKRLSKGSMGETESNGSIKQTAQISYLSTFSILFEYE